MTEKKTTDSRRKALKSIAAGTGVVVAGKTLPESWSKPVVDAVMLPAHAVTSACCEGVFCGLDFGGPDSSISGSAKVSNDCTIGMQGDSEGGFWSGDGSVMANGTFSFTAYFPEHKVEAQVTGTVGADCSSITGEMTFPEGSPASFSGPVTPGVTSMDNCAIKKF